MLKKLWSSGIKGKVALIAGIIVLMCLCCVFLIVFVPGSSTQESAPADLDQVYTQAAETAQQLITPTETETPTTPTATLEPAASMRLKIEQALGSGNRDIPRFNSFSWDEARGEISVTFAANDNLSEGLIKIGIQTDIADILKIVSENKENLPYQSLVVASTFSLVDVYGNAEEKNVVIATYTRENLEQINWDNFLHENVYVIANQDSLFLHPALTP